MPAKKITRKIISGRKSPVIAKPVVKETVSLEKATETEIPKEGRPKRYCFFCKNKLIPTYTDIVNLRRFLTDRAKILPKQRSGVCSKHQRGVAKNIKYARHLSLLPFVPKV